MQALIDLTGMNHAQRNQAAAIALIHSTKHWAERKKVYTTKAGVFLVRCNKIIKIRLKPNKELK